MVLPEDIIKQILSNCRFDFEQSAFSPTELDDSFMFYYRHPKNTENSNNLMQSKVITSNLPDNIQVTTVKKNQDFSKHPAPCQKYLQNLKGELTVVLKIFNSPTLNSLRHILKLPDRCIETHEQYFFVN